MAGKNAALPLKFGTFEVQHKANLALCDPTTVKPLPPLMIGDSFNYFGVHHDGAKSD